MKRIVYACDIGSTRKKKFAWARVDLAGRFRPQLDNKIDTLVEHLTKDLADGSSVALGFEAPLFMPIPPKSNDLSHGRMGEGNRSLFAPAGASVSTLAIHQTAFILKGILDSGRMHNLTVDLSEWRASKKRPCLFLWEAFVSGDAHVQNGHDHHDAATAAKYFVRYHDDPKFKSDVNTDHECLSMIGAVAIWSGWTNDVEILKKKCLVFRPKKKIDRYLG